MIEFLGCISICCLSLLHINVDGQILYYSVSKCDPKTEWINRLFAGFCLYIKVRGHTEK